MSSMDVKMIGMFELECEIERLDVDSELCIGKRYSEELGVECLKSVRRSKGVDVKGLCRFQDSSGESEIQMIDVLKGVAN